MIAKTGTPAAAPTAQQVLDAIAGLTEEQQKTFMASIGLTYNSAEARLEVPTDDGTMAATLIGPL